MSLLIDIHYDVGANILENSRARCIELQSVVCVVCSVSILVDIHPDDVDANRLEFSPERAM